MSLSPEVESVLSSLVVGDEVAVVLPPLPGICGERRVTVQIIPCESGFDARVSGGSFGVTKRQPTAIKRIRARLEYLWANPGYLVVTDEMRADAQAASVLRELRRREKIQRGR